MATKTARARPAAAAHLAPPAPAHIAPLLGIYHSSQDRCTRRVFWQDGQLMQARTRPGCPEEDPYPLAEAFLRRLLTYRLYLPS